jgi:holo-[acyl-carrier protein] synthase
MENLTRVGRVGFDLVSVESVASAVRDHGEQYLSRVYTARERAECGDTPERLAARFAGKEATLKVLRPRCADAIPWVTIELVQAPGCSAELCLRGAAAALADAAALDDFAVSLTQNGGLASAVVVAMANE